MAAQEAVAPAEAGPAGGRTIPLQQLCQPSPMNKSGISEGQQVIVRTYTDSGVDAWFAVDYIESEAELGTYSDGELRLLRLRDRNALDLVVQYIWIVGG